MHPETDVAIVGSGPYALSLAAHLRMRGIEFRIFGPPMRFWRDMPVGINLKSFAHATNVYVPTLGTTFPEWCRARGFEDFEPCTMESFAAYGMWVAERFVPNAESIEVSCVSVDRAGGFELTLANEDRLRARRVVFATGLSYLAFTPEVLRALPPELVSHTFDVSDYSRFRGKAVAIVGAGASAIEAGALVHEAGGRPQILVREAEAIFHDRIKPNRSLLDRLHKPISVLGPGKKNRIMEALPLALHFVPERRRVRFVKGYLGPAAPWWIIPRVQGVVPILVRTTIVGAERHGEGVRLTLREAAGGEQTIEVDHVIAGTGFTPDVDRLAYLDDAFRQRLRRVECSPALSMNFESSIPGAYFIGPITALCFGPLFRFVAGAKYAAPALARHLAGTRRSVATAVRRWTGLASRRQASDETGGGPKPPETTAASLPPGRDTRNASRRVR
jgi:FAD-dependent urate hydroxylase